MINTPVDWKKRNKGAQYVIRTLQKRIDALELEIQELLAKEKDS